MQAPKQQPSERKRWKTPGSAWLRTHLGALGLIVFLVGAWAVHATITTDFADPKPYSLDETGPGEARIELRADLNEYIFDGERYDEGAGWFERRAGDIRSAVRVTKNEWSTAHRVLASKAGEGMDFTLYQLANISGGIEGSDDNYINNYLLYANEYAPETVDEFVGWVATSINPDSTGPMLMMRIVGDAREYMTSAVERLPGDGSQEPTRRGVIERFGGSRSIGRTLVKSYFSAVLREDLDEATRAAEHCARWYRLVPGLLPAYLETIGHHTPERIDDLMDRYDVFYFGQERATYELHLLGSESRLLFEDFLGRELGLTAEEIEEI